MKLPNTRIVGLITLFLLYFNVELTWANDSNADIKLTKQKEEQILVLRSELEFLATKLLEITDGKEYTLSHGGHTLVIFGICGAEHERGVMVKCVSPHTAAYNMGIRSGDIVTELNKEKFNSADKKESYQRYLDLVTNLKDGDSVSVEYIRDGRRILAESTIKSIFSPGYYFKVDGTP